MPRGFTREQRAAKAALEANEAAASRAPREPAAQAPEPVEHTEPAGEMDDTTITRVQLKNDPRDKAMAELEAKHAKRSGIEPAAEEEQAAEPAAEPQAPEAPQAATEPAPEPVAAPEPTPEPVAEMVTVKVDGETFQVSKAEVEDAGGVRAYQTIRAADNRLKKANDALAETRRTQDQAVAFARAMAQQAQPPVPKKSPDELIQAIRFGTAEEARAAFLEMSGTPQSINQNEVVMQAAAINNYNSARRRFAGEFQDLLTDETLVDAVKAKENRAVQAFAQNGQVNWQNLANVDFDVFFRNIGNQVRSAFRRPSQPQPASQAAPAVPATTAGSTSSPPSSASQTREDRKASIVNLPTAASRATPPAEEKPESREEILNGIRKARGLPVG